MTQAQPGLAEMNARMNQWMNEKPQGNFNNTTELRLNQNDLVIFQFAASGNDGDRLIKAYRSHIFGQTSKTGKRFNEARYCPVQNGEGQECMFCQAIASGQLPANTGELKERMSMWLLVHQILHAQMPQVRQGEPVPNWPIVNYEGSNYYMEEVNAWKVWHTSAWRESPWSDICRSASMYGSLHAFTAQILCTGQGMNKRFKFYVLPNSAPLPREYYEQAYSSLTPIPDMLREEASKNLSQNPQPQGGQWSGQQPVANNFVPGGLPAPGAPMQFQPAMTVPTTFVPPAAPAPVLNVPSATPPPLATTAPPPPATFQPGSNPPTPGVPNGNVAPPHIPTMAEAPVSHPNEAPPAPVQAPTAVAAPVAPPQAPAAPVSPPAPPIVPSIPPQAPVMPATPPPVQPPAPPTNAAPEDSRRPMRRMF